MDMATEESPLTDLVAALEQATLMAKQIPIATDPSQLTHIYATLHSTHHRLSSFLSQTSHPPPPQPSLPPPLAAAAAENSLSSAAGNGEPMQVGDEEEEEEESMATIERVEERMRDCFIQNKRPKRPLSPAAAAAAEQRRRVSSENDLVGGSSLGFDPQGTRLRSLDLIYQFHG